MISQIPVKVGAGVPSWVPRVSTRYWSLLGIQHIYGTKIFFFPFSTHPIPLLVYTRLYSSPISSSYAFSYSFYTFINCIFLLELSSYSSLLLRPPSSILLHPTPATTPSSSSSSSSFHPLIAPHWAPPELQWKSERHQHASSLVRRTRRSCSCSLMSDAWCWRAWSLLQLNLNNWSGDIHIDKTDWFMYIYILYIYIHLKVQILLE